MSITLFGKISDRVNGLVDILLKFEASRPLPFWFFLIIITVGLTSLGFFLGTSIHPVLLLIFTSIPAYPIYLAQFKAKRYGKAMAYVFLWALTISVTITLLTLLKPESASVSILSGISYQEEMFVWIATGVGKEGSPSVFIPEHLGNAAVFTLLSLPTGGVLSLLFGAYQMNYMSFYVGTLLANTLNPTLPTLLKVALLSWPIYAIIRVIGFVCIGVGTTMPLANKLFTQKLKLSLFLRFLFLGTIFVLTDIGVKIVVAPLYCTLLSTLVNAG